MANVFFLNGSSGAGQVVEQSNGRWTVRLSIHHWDADWTDRVLYLAMYELDSGTLVPADGPGGDEAGNDYLGSIRCRVVPADVHGHDDPAYAGPWTCELIPDDPRASPPTYLSAPRQENQNPDTFDLQLEQPGGTWSAPISVPLRGERISSAAAAGAGDTAPGNASAPSGTTAAPSDASTAAPSDASTAAPTDASTAAPTDASTAAPTDASAAAPTDASAAAPTDASAAAPAPPPGEGDSYEIDFTFKNPIALDLQGVHYAAHSAISPRRRDERGPRKWVRLREEQAATASAAPGWSDELERNCELQARLYYYVLREPTELGEPLADDPGHASRVPALSGIGRAHGLADCPRPRDGVTTRDWRTALARFQTARQQTPADGDPFRALAELRVAAPRWVPAWYAGREVARDLGAAIGQGPEAVTAWYAGLLTAGDTRAQSAQTALMNVVRSFVPLPGDSPGLVAAAGAGACYGLQETMDFLVRVGAAWEQRRDQDRAAGGLVRPCIRVGEISQRCGGPFPPHSTHQMGVDIDIATMRDDGDDAGAGDFRSAHYSRALMFDLIQLILDSANSGPVRVWVVWFNDGEVLTHFDAVRDERHQHLVTSQPNHDNHIHVKLHHPLTDPLYALYGLIQSARHVARPSDDSGAGTGSRSPRPHPKPAPRAAGRAGSGGASDGG